MEVLMRHIISAFLTISFVAVFGAATFAQTPGLRVEANIPFDFTVGKNTFASGSYDLVLTRIHNSIYTASLMDSSGNLVLKTVAVRNGATNRDSSQMIFSVSEGGKYLETIRTPEMGFQFATSKKDRLLASTQKVAVPAEGSPNF